MIEVGESSILRISPPDFKATYEPSKRRLTWPNGVVATTFSGDEPEQLRGPQHRSVWIDELPKFDSPEEAYTQMDLGLRIGNDAACIITTTPTPTKIIKELYKSWEENPEGLIRVTTGSTLDNAANLGAAYISSVKKRYAGTRLEQQEIHGKILWDSEDALFTTDTLEKYRAKEAPELVSIVVAVDPAVTNTKDSDTTAIVVCGIDSDGHGYVLYSHSMKSSPNIWAQKVIAVFDQFDADYVVIEVNNGGDLLKSTLEQARKNLPTKEVRASKGKITRMEPISLLAEQGRVHMVGYQQALEDQLVQYNGKGNSPDLYDAMCWGLSSLMLGKRSVVTSSEFLL